MNGVMFYFSGTGNSKFIADEFGKIMRDEYKQPFEVHSIGESCDFQTLIEQNPVIGFCYPIYGSCVPRIMREFTAKIKPFLTDKKLIIFCTQLMFSGDGARAFTDLIKGIPVEVILAEHFDMPNNICNLPFLKVKNGDELKTMLLKAEKRLEKACKALAEGEKHLRGFNLFSGLLGLIQRPAFLQMEKTAAHKIIVDNSVCTRCEKCVRECPTSNLFIENHTVRSKGVCTLCYRCVNRCPNRAITVWLTGKIKQQYKGIQ